MSKLILNWKRLLLFKVFSLKRTIFWKGDVKLRNLQLKKEALDKFNLPIDILEGVMFDKKIRIKKLGTCNNLPVKCKKF